MIYKSSNIFLDNCNFINSLNVYLLKTRHYNKNMNKLFIFFNKAKKAIISNTVFALFLFKRSLFFIIELVYNKGYIFIINTLFSNSFKINKKLIFFKYFVNLFNNSMVNGFITNSSYLFKYIFNKVKRKKKISKRILQKFLKNSLNKLVINNKTKNLVYSNQLNILKVFNKKKKYILFKYLKKLKKKYKLKKKAKIKIINKLKKIINKKINTYNKIFIKVKEHIYSKIMSNFQINKILKIYLKNVKKLLKLELKKDKSFLLNNDFLNYNIRKNLRIKLNKKKISKTKRKKLKFRKLMHKYKRYIKKKYKENFIYVKQLKSKKNSMVFGPLYTRVKNKRKSYFFMKKIRNKRGNKFLNKKNKSILFKFLFKNLMSKYKKIKIQDNFFEKTIVKKVKINFLKNFSLEIFFLIKKKNY